jgi:Ca2+-binding RTX toxin-like protein
VGVLLGDGSGGFSGPTRFEVGGGDGVVAADFDGDGVADIGANRGDGTLALLRNAAPAAGTLTVDGTTGDDRVLVARAADPALFSITVNGATRMAPAAGVTRIAVRGLAGNDRLEVQTNIALPCTLDGGPGDDRLLGGGGRDELTGGDGNDQLDGRGGADVFRGGAGTDTADYTARRNAVRVGIGTAADDGENNEGDNVLTDVENVWGGRGNDTIRGSDARNRLAGGAGDDVIYGNAGRDVLVGGDGNDRLFARDGDSDTVNGGSGTDRADVDRSDVVAAVEERTPPGPFFSTDFSVPALHPSLQDPDAAYAITGGVIRQTRTGAESYVRRYVRTARSDYSGDFQFDLTYSATGITFIGVGAGDPTPPFSEPAADSLYLRLHGPTVVGGRVDISYDNNFNTIVYDAGSITDPGPHRARITRTGDLIRFQVDAQPSGPFVPEIDATVDLAEHPEIRAALQRESRLFFGTGETNAPFDNFSVGAVDARG